MVSPEQIAELTKDIVAIANPEKVLLFGSYANGTATEDSDVDLLVVMDKLTTKRHELTTSIYSKIWKKFNFSKDILVYSISDIERLKDVKHSFLTSVVNTGKIVFERG